MGRFRKAKLTDAQRKAIFARMARAGFLYVSPKSARVNPHGKRLDVTRDRKRKALPAGKRISESGNTYYEKRANRADVNKYDHRKKKPDYKGQWL